MNNFGDVVVGYDGSKGARRAVEFAASEAATHQARLRIVSVWSKAAPAVAALSPVPVPLVAAERARLAEQRLEEAAELARAVAPGIEIDTVAIEGGAAAELVRATANSRLLVVGCRGHGGVQGLLLGSVSRQCALQAHCPVLIVPALVDDRPPVHDAA